MNCQPPVQLSATSVFTLQKGKGVTGFIRKTDNRYSKNGCLFNKGEYINKL